MMVLVQNKYKNTLVGVLRTQTTFGDLGPQKTDSGVFIIFPVQKYRLFC